MDIEQALAIVESATTYLEVSEVLARDLRKLAPHHRAQLMQAADVAFERLRAHDEIVIRQFMESLPGAFDDTPSGRDRSH